MVSRLFTQHNEAQALHWSGAAVLPGEEGSHGIDKPALLLGEQTPSETCSEYPGPQIGPRPALVLEAAAFALLE
jgi:hypothetical protein